MNIFFILILIVIAILGLGFGLTLWFASRHMQAYTSQEPAQGAAKRAAVTFRWRYIMLPIAISLLFIVLAAVFYPRLPAEIGYHFKPDGTPDRWLSREIAMVLMLAPQLLLTLLAGATTGVITKLGILSGQTEGTGIEPQKILSRMGNVVALPQIVIGLVILDIFTYNAYQIHILPTWAFLLILGVATVTLILILVFTIRKARKEVTLQSEDSRNISD